MRNTNQRQRNLQRRPRAWWVIALLLTAVALSLLTLAACGSDPTPTSQPTATAVPTGPEPAQPTATTAVPTGPEPAQPTATTAVPTGPEPAHTYRTEIGKYGGTLKLGMASEHTTYDPPLGAVSADLNVIDQVYEQLVEHNPDLSFQPLLAERWEKNAELTEWTFFLRKGVKFHHGKEMKAEDVVYSYNRLLEVESPSAGQLSSIIDKVVAVDDYTVRFELSSGTAFFLDTLALVYHFKILPSDVDPARFTNEEFGTGPFIMTEDVIGERTVFKKNPDYWWTGYPYLDEVIFIYLPDPQARLEALKTGAVDYHRYMPLTEVADVEADPNLKVSIVASSSYIHMNLDVTVPPFDNKLVRQAIQAATDRDAINQSALLGNGAVGYDHPIPPFDPHFSDEARANHPGYDPELAKSLLEQAGYPDGIDIILYTSTNPGAPMLEFATVMQQKGVPAGIRYEIRVMPEATYWSNVWLVEPVYTSYWAGRTPDAALSLTVLSTSDWNESHYINPRLDDLIVQARIQPELEDRRATYRELQEILIEDVPRIIPVFQVVVNGMASKVHGMDSDPGAWFWTRYGWLDD
jgi:peptide/nickel transport system substrate-binding protein